MKTVAVIQARMGSTRLPGKVLRLLRGQPLIWHCIERLRRSREVDELILATSTSAEDDPLVEYAGSLGVRVVRGPEENVLQRFVLAIADSEAEIIVRVTGDAPLVDPDIVDLCVRRLEESGAEFVIGDGAFPILHEGTDTFHRRAFERLADEAREDPVAREHIAAFFKLHPDFVTTTSVGFSPELRFEGARLSVDTPEDLKFLERLHEELDAAAGQVELRDAVKLLRRKPQLLEINRRVRQKDVRQATRHVVIRCDGDGEIGLGHVYRCLSIARELRDHHGCAVRFAVSYGEQAVSLIESRDFVVFTKANGEDEVTWLGDIFDREAPVALLVDVRRGLEETTLRSLCREGLFIAVLDDQDDRRLVADAVFYPPVPQLESLSWPRFTGTVYSGWEFVALREQFSRHTWQGLGEAPNVLLCLGGGDPTRSMAALVETLERCKSAFSVRLLLGRAFASDSRLQRTLDTCHRSIEVYRDVTDVASLLASSSLALLSFGGIAFEAAVMGVPALHLSLSEDHLRSAEVFARQGMARSLGLMSPLPVDGIRKEIDHLFAAPHELEALSKAAASKLDTKGPRRIAEVMLKQTVLE